MKSSFHLKGTFKKLVDNEFEPTSPRTGLYNCLAWAANDMYNWWWPDEDGYWPEGVNRKHDIQSFIDAYSTIGYKVCDNSELEPGIEKIAVYLNTEGPQHAARQLESGFWTSKLGPYEDITHNYLHGVDCNEYGKAAVFMSKPRTGGGK